MIKVYEDEMLAAFYLTRSHEGSKARKPPSPTLPPRGEGSVSIEKYNYFIHFKTSPLGDRGGYLQINFTFPFI
jgi:hypothetical protein